MENKTMITLNKEQLETLENMIGEMPTKWGLPILDYLKALFHQQNQKQVETPVVDIKEEK